MVYEIYSDDLHAILDESDFTLFSNMLKAPAAIRNFVQISIASELIAPVFKEELKADTVVRQDIDYDYYASSPGCCSSTAFFFAATTY